MLHHMGPKRDYQKGSVTKHNRSYANMSKRNITYRQIKHTVFTLILTKANRASRSNNEINVDNCTNIEQVRGSTTV